MEILYFGSACDKKWFEMISLKNNAPFTVAQYMFETAFLCEISNKKNTNINVNYIYRDTYFPKNKILLLREKRKNKLLDIEVKYMSFINLPFIKELCMIINGFSTTLKWGLIKRKNKDKIILLAIQYPPIALGVKIASKLLNLKRVIIITDVAQSTYDKNKIKKMPIYKRIIMSIYKKIVFNLEQGYDGYVFFSKPMNALINKKSKPYTIMEGIFNSDGINLDEVDKKYAIMHAGTLSKEVGVKNIIDVFMRINDKRLELWLFGDGNLKEYIIEMQKIDSRIKYYGFKPRSEVFEYQKKATILINLRNPDDEYTRYSFPSKTFEYMVSGTPFATTELECIPEEYKDHLIIIKGNNLEEIKEELDNILLDTNALNKKGKLAQKFILRNKTPKKQVEKIYDLLKKI